MELLLAALIAGVLIGMVIMIYSSNRREKAQIQATEEKERDPFRISALELTREERKVLGAHAPDPNEVIMHVRFEVASGTMMSDARQMVNDVLMANIWAVQANGKMVPASANFALETALELRAFDVGEQHLQNRIAFAFGQLRDARRERVVHEQRLAPADGMGANHGVLAARIGLARIVIRAIAPAVDMLAVVYGAHAVQHLLQRLGQCLESAVHVGEQRVTADRRNLEHVQNRAERRLGVARDV